MPRKWAFCTCPNMVRLCKALVARLYARVSTNHTLQGSQPSTGRTGFPVANLVLGLKHGLYKVWLLITKNPGHQQTPMNWYLGPTSVANVFLVGIIQANPELHLVLAGPAMEMVATHTCRPPIKRRTAFFVDSLKLGQDSMIRARFASAKADGVGFGVAFGSKVHNSRVSDGVSSPISSTRTHCGDL